MFNPISIKLIEWAQEENSRIKASRIYKTATKLESKFIKVYDTAGMSRQACSFKPPPIEEGAIKSINRVPPTPNSVPLPMQLSVPPMPPVKPPGGSDTK